MIRVSARADTGVAIGVSASSTLSFTHPGAEKFSYIYFLVISVVVLNRLVSAIGVRDTALIQPLAYLGIFGDFMLESLTAQL